MQQRKDDPVQNRKDLDLMFKKEKKIQLKKYQNILLLIGSIPMYNTIHSEPPFNKLRLFLSILPGTEKEMKKRYQFITTVNPEVNWGKWHEKY